MIHTDYTPPPFFWLGAQADYDPDVLLSCETLNEALCGIIVDLTDPQADE